MVQAKSQQTDKIYIKNHLRTFQNEVNPTIMTSSNHVHYINESDHNNEYRYSAPRRPTRRRDDENIGIGRYGIGPGRPRTPDDWEDQEIGNRNYIHNHNNHSNVQFSGRRQNEDGIGNSNSSSGGVGAGAVGSAIISSSVPRSSPRRLVLANNDEDIIETASASSGSGSSGYGRPSRKYLHYNSQRNGEIGHTVKMSRIPEKFHDEKDGSEIYVMDSAFPKNEGGGRPLGSAYSQYSSKSRAPSEMSSVKTKTSRKGGVVVDTMSAPNPFCPNTKGVCCLLVLVNLGLILVTLGFSIVLQLFDPPFVWYCGIAFLIVGFIALIVSLLFCVHLCRESRETQRQNGLQPGELYWTHHWQKRIAIPGMGRTERGKADDLSTVYSARTDDRISERKQYYDQSDQHSQAIRDRDSMTPIHSYRH